MALSEEMRTLLVLAVLFTIPGWFLLALTGGWKIWPTLQRWCVAVGLSIAFFPILFYFARLLPSFQLGQYKLIALLAVMLIATAWLLRKSWRDSFHFDNLEALALGLLFATLFTRLYAAYLHPYPAWSDSLHHTLLTQLTASQGRLPTNFLPYAPTSLDMYHLGLYAISGTLEMLAKVPAHTALLWTAQALNGLCGLGVFFVLDRKVGRIGAIAGTAVVGLFSFQPAWYINWGRDTQIASQAVLLIAWLVTWEAISAWRLPSEKRGQAWALTLISALLTAGVFLLHFRVAYFYIPLLALTVLVEFSQALSTKTLQRLLVGLVVITAISVVMVSPALFGALKAYLYNRAHPEPVSVAVSQAATNSYYDFPLSSLWQLGIQPWLLVVSVAALLFGFYRRRQMTFLMAAWTLLLALEGWSYLLKIPLLNITNMGAVLILFYMPASIVIGQAAEDLWHFSIFRSPQLQRATLAVFLIGCYIASFIRVNGIEDYRYFLAPADVQAMDWIKANTSQNALFAINTYFWFPNSPHGSDGGYWIPYFTGRRTTAGTMLFNLTQSAYTQEIIRQSTAVKDLKEQYSSIEGLCKEGINFIYLGAKGDFSGNGLDANRLLSVPGITSLYQHSGVGIFQVHCP